MARPWPFAHHPGLAAVAPAPVFFALQKKQGLVHGASGPLLMPRPCSTARALPPAAARPALTTVALQENVMLITSLCASRSGWLPASPNSKVYCIPHKPPAYGGGLWGFRTAPYSPPLFFCFAKKPGAGSWTSGHSHPGGNSPPHPEAHPTFSYGKSEGELLTARPAAPA